MRPALYLHALRVARWRQLRARATRPLRRRVFPSGAESKRSPAPLPQAEELWRSPAFAAAPSPPEGTRLARFHQNYGEDVLAAARLGDVDRARALVTRWVDANPPRNDDAWHPYVLSTRVGNWIAALTLVPELASPALSDLLWRQLERLKSNVEEEVLGNHVIRNSRALVLGGAAFGAPKLTEQGLALLERELPEQVLADGGHYERSPVYHLVVLRDLLEIEAVAPQPWLSPVIERMHSFAAAMQRPDGQPALFNDGWLDLAPRLELPRAPDGLTVLRESGFAVVRDGPLWLAFRCGPLAPSFLPAHVHADALSFQLWWDGEPVVVDPGSYTYEPGEDRDWFRSTRAHSTLCIDGRDQFELWGAFRAGPLPSVRLEHAGRRELVASASYRGVRHERCVRWDAGEVTVDDAVVGRARTVDSRLLLAPGARVEAEAIGALELIPEEGWLSERFFERKRTTIRVARRSGAGELGWRLPRKVSP
jgi:hypothetical protein